MSGAFLTARYAATATFVSIVTAMFRILRWAAVAGAAYLAVRNAPDIKRYLKMRQM